MKPDLFSKEELFKLRNNIPVDSLIQNHFKIPTKISEGFLRFLCPLCSDFNTAINNKTNLARCFLCKKNFNPIDLTMTVRSLNFKEAVFYLQALFNRKISFYSENNTEKALPINEILATCLNNINVSESSHNSTQNQIASLENKILVLEKQILLIKNCLNKFAG